MSDCPTCGQGFDHGQAMKIHHTKTHGESIAGVGVKCAYCGDEKKVRASEAEKRERHFCDQGCHGEWLSENRSGEASPSWKGHVEVKCAYCGEVMEREPAEAERSERHFCDHSCYGDWASETRIGEDHPLWRGQIEVTCLNCGREFERPRWHVEQNDGRDFCDTDCQNTWRSEFFSGKGNPRWGGGYDGYYGPSWPAQRLKAIQRDNENCVLCGLPREKHRERYGMDLVVHHKTEFSHYGHENHKEANRLGNLVTLCNSCHPKVEHSVEELSDDAPDVTDEPDEDIDEDDEQVREQFEQLVEADD